MTQARHLLLIATQRLPAMKPGGCEVGTIRANRHTDMILRSERAADSEMKWGCPALAGHFLQVAGFGERFVRVVPERDKSVLL